MSKLPTQLPMVPTERAAITPYNFVPLPEKVVPAYPRDVDQQTGEQKSKQKHVDQSIYHADRCTGVLSCTLTTASPLYLRCGYTPEQFAAMGEMPFNELTDAQKQLRALFFHHGNPESPRIPGSSLRGMLRALVEIASYSKMDKVSDAQRYFYRAVASRTADSLTPPYRNQLRNVRAGYLKQRGRAWFIEPAQSIGSEAYLKVREQDVPRSVGLIRLNDPRYCLQVIPVSFTTRKLKPSPRSPQGRLVIDRIDNVGVHSETGMIVTSGNMLETSGTGMRSPRKNHAVVGVRGTGELPIAANAIDDYRNGLTPFQIEQLGPNGVLEDGRPVFYCEPAKGSKEVIYFGHSPNFRLPYRFAGSERAASPYDFVPNYLRDDGDTDIAEALFGYVRRSKQQGEQALAGRVFVSDAALVPNQLDIWYSPAPITPQILATPKPTTFQHYLVQTSSALSELNHYGSKPVEQTVVRGHKMYWHKGESPDIHLPTNQQQTSDTQKTLIKPIRAGVSFTFTIRFENLTDVELGALLWVLQLAADDQYRLHLGMGKPLGMGAVAIHSDLHLDDRKARYTALFSSEGWEVGRRAISTEEEWHQSIQAFEKYVLKESGDSSRDGQLQNTLRLQCLRALLRWPGPQPTMTRYMEIERTRQDFIPAATLTKPHDPTVNEYKLRPVLPTPIQSETMVFDGSTPIHAQTTAGATQSRQSTASQIPKIGEIHSYRISAVDETLVMVLIAGFDKSQAIGVLKAETIADGKTSRYRVGNSARVEVIAIQTLKNGRVIVELKPASKT